MGTFLLSDGMLRQQMLHVCAHHKHCSLSALGLASVNLCPCILPCLQARRSCIYATTYLYSLIHLSILLPQMTLKSFLQAAQKAFASHDFEGALSHCESALQHDGRSYNALV